MNTRMKERLAALGLTGALLGGGALVFAQTQTTPTTPAQTTPAQTQDGLDGVKGGRFGLDGHGFGHGAGFGRLALGTTVEVTLYDGDPAAGGTVTDTLNFTYGEDSEAAFAQSLDAARQTAALMTVNVGEQTRTVDLSTVALPTDGRGLLPRELASARAPGDDVTVTFYDGDPAAGGAATDTLAFTYGTDSEAGFAADFSTAAATAAYVTLTTSPQSYTVDLAQVQARGQDGFGLGADFGGRGFEDRGFEGRRGHR